MLVVVPLTVSVRSFNTRFKKQIYKRMEKTTERSERVRQREETTQKLYFPSLQFSQHFTFKFWVIFFLFYNLYFKCLVLWRLKNAILFKRACFCECTTLCNLQVQCILYIYMYVAICVCILINFSRIMVYCTFRLSQTFLTLVTSPWSIIGY